MTKAVEPCSIDGCTAPVLARGWCNAHYGRWRRLGDPCADIPLGGMYDARRQSCSVDGCGRPRHTDGLCTTHRYRQDRGTPLEAPIQPRGMDLAQAVRRNVHIGFDDACWPAKHLQAEGYGQLHALGASWLAHRAAWTALVGPIPAGRELHHTCRNRACANPAHLQPVTAAEHQRLHGASH